MNIRGGYMKGLFIMFIMFSLFISGCELIEEQEFQMNGGPQMSWPWPEEEWNIPFALPVDKKGGGSLPSASTCESTFVGGLCSDTGLDLYAVCSLKPNLECSSGDWCVGPFNGLVDICGGDYIGWGWGECYCVGDGECHTEFGEPTTSIDCQDCTSGDTQSCNLPSDPGTCGECNEGLKTCTNGQWGTCEQVTFPEQEICDNAFDEDCDCNPDYVDADCITHLECDGSNCVEFPGEGSNTCNVNADCAEPTHLECDGSNCVEVSGTGPNQCSADLDCATHTECNGNEECVEVSGEGPNTCNVNTDCVLPTHMECNENRECIEVSGVGSNQCSGNLDCPVELINGDFSQRYADYTLVGWTNYGDISSAYHQNEEGVALHGDPDNGYLYQRIDVFPGEELNLLGRTHASNNAVWGPQRVTIHDSNGNLIEEYIQEGIVYGGVEFDINFIAVDDEIEIRLYPNSYDYMYFLGFNYYYDFRFVN